MFMPDLAHGTELWNTNLKMTGWSFPVSTTFPQRLVSRAKIEALMGSKILELDPILSQGFWTRA